MAVEEDELSNRGMYGVSKAEIKDERS